MHGQLHKLYIVCNVCMLANHLIYENLMLAILNINVDYGNCIIIKKAGQPSTHISHNNT